MKIWGTGMDINERKQVLRLFTYGLYAIGVRRNDEANAFTANWLTQVSFDPLLLALSVERDAWSWPLLEETGVFTINVLASGQRDLAGQLGRSRYKVGDKLASLAWQAAPMTGCPVLHEDALAYVECRAVGVHPAGDSWLVVAEVLNVKSLRPGEPLTMKEAGFRHAG
jgi:flavin reductase (DIM6/NTAB) family NADH-FMN oxidoreductase RutF